MKNELVGMVLAGGEGRRMGYQNKGLLHFNGKSLVSHVIERLTPQVDRIIISANADLADYQQFGLEIVCDQEQYRGKGPLAGIAAVIATLPDSAVLQVVTCDGPFLASDLVETLTLHRQQRKVVAVYPVTALQPQYSYMQAEVAAMRGVTKLLERNDLRIKSLLDEMEAEPIRFTNDLAFSNCNSEQDIQILEKKGQLC